jgi:hypothetical protein
MTTLVPPQRTHIAACDKIELHVTVVRAAGALAGALGMPIAGAFE